MQRRTNWPLAVLFAAALGLAAPVIASGQELPPRPDPAASPADSGGDTATAGATITGTVIDETTGAPAAGVPVQVGAVVVTSDQDGNYGRDGLEPGSYQVSLALPAGRGTPSHGAQTVSVTAGARVVQHLFFRSAPAAVAPDTQAPPAVPAELPRTGADDDGALVLLAMGLATGSAGAWLRRRR